MEIKNNRIKKQYKRHKANEKIKFSFSYIIENDIEKNELIINFPKYVKKIKMSKKETPEAINTLIRQTQEW